MVVWSVIPPMARYGLLSPLVNFMNHLWMQGVPPASLAEFTLNAGGVDYYDGTYSQALCVSYPDCRV